MAELDEFKKQIGDELVKKKQRLLRYKKERDEARAKFARLENQKSLDDAAAAAAAATAVKAAAAATKLQALKDELSGQKDELKKQLEQEQKKITELENQKKLDDTKCEQEKAAYRQFVHQAIADLDDDSDNEGAAPAAAQAAANKYNRYNLNF